MPAMKPGRAVRQQVVQVVEEEPQVAVDGHDCECRRSEEDRSEQGHEDRTDTGAKERCLGPGEGVAVQVG